MVAPRPWHSLQSQPATATCATLAAPLPPPPCAPACRAPRRDPGNWATGLAGGAKFGYQLLFVILLSNVLAMFLQHLALKLGVASGRDLAQACRDAYPR